MSAFDDTSRARQQARALLAATSPLVHVQLREMLAGSGALDKYDEIRAAVIEYLDAEHRLAHSAASSETRERRSQALAVMRRVAEHRPPWCPCDSCKRKRRHGIES